MAQRLTTGTTPPSAYAALTECHGFAWGACRYAHSMAGEAAVRKVAEAAGERAQGASVSRSKALLASVIIGIGAAVATFKLLRSGGEQ